MKTIHSLFFMFAGVALFVGSALCGAEKTIPLLSLQVSKMVDNTGNVRVADRTAMAEILRGRLEAVGFKILEESMMVAAIKENDKADVIGAQQNDAAGDDQNLAVPRYFLQLSIEKCNYILQDGQRVFQMVLRLSATDARNGKSVAVVENSKPVIAGNARDGIVKCIEGLVPLFISSMPERFRPELPSGKILKVSDNRILVKIPAESIQVGKYLDVFRIEKLDLDDDKGDKKKKDDDDDDDDDDEDDDLVDEVLVGTLKVVETKKAFCVCIPVGLAGHFEKGNLARLSIRVIAE